MLEEDFA